MSDNFQRRCGSALTHPLTIGAVFALLLNDLALKPLWPGHWGTGKLSDLAWMVFAPPLLAFLLSHLTRRNPFAERGAFTIAYLGLPLLYVAFNTLEPLHSWILSGLLSFTGSETGSPLDPTDSIVIPPALGLVLWIWHRAPAQSESLRMRVRLYAAIAASLATVATSVSGPSPTQWFAGISGEGTVIVEGANYELYESHDGGLTWVAVPYDPEREIQWGSDSVETPRGTYLIQGSSIRLLSQTGESKEVFSTAYLKKSANVWAQKYATRKLRSDMAEMYEDPGEFIATRPFNIVYDEKTGNLVVALGLQGVLVGDSSGFWRRVAVGDFSPTDFSLLGKLA